MSLPASVAPVEIVWTALGVVGLIPAAHLLLARWREWHGLDEDCIDRGDRIVVAGQLILDLFLAGVCAIVVALGVFFMSQPAVARPVTPGQVALTAAFLGIVALVDAAAIAQDWTRSRLRRHLARQREQARRGGID